ncbi:MAG: HAD-IB family phosphatase [Paraglaciecola sp.]|uniref:HAD-IB family phosphatase n=1 Tax=Paraglaciecola sp. TaxID=1920173 RepID=UPI003299797F
MNVFVSHNSIDRDIASKFVDLLINGMGVKKDKVVCTSVPGVDIPAGADFQDFIKLKLGEDGVLFALITKNYYRSTFSMYELGASWAQSKKTIPILIDTNYENLKDFLLTRIAIKYDCEEDLNKVRDYVRQDFNANADTNTWEHKRKEFISSIQEFLKLPKDRGNMAPTLNLSPSKHKYKLVAFDLDGTLLHGKKGVEFKYSWKLIWDHLGYDDSVRHALHEKHVKDAASYSYKEWCHDCAKHFIDKGLTKDAVLSLVKSNLKEAPNLKLLLRILKNNGVKTAIISGGIDTFMKHGLSKEANDLIDVVCINKFEYDLKKNLVRIDPQSAIESDFDGKLRTMEMLCEELKIPLKDSVFVGEGMNDIALGRSDCLSIAYPEEDAEEDFMDEANHCLKRSDLLRVLEYVFVSQ